MSGMRLWDLQPGETITAFRAFQVYRDTPAERRSIAKCCRARHKAKYSKTVRRRWEKWSSQWNWVERARAWEIELDHATQDGTLKAVEEMREKHVKESQGIQRVAVRSLAKLIEQVERGDRQLSPSLILQFLTQGASMERLARGEPNEIVENLGDDGVFVIDWIKTNGPAGIQSPDASAAPGTVDGSEE